MVTLYTSYYQDKNPIRQAELDYCLKQNIDNPFIDRIMIFAESSLPFTSEKVQIISDKRPTYNDKFNAINHYIVSPIEISIVANSDIYFDETLKELQSMLNGRFCYALSRYDVKPDSEPVLHQEKFSQDTWIFCGKVKPIKFGAFHLGVPGCDNRIAWELNRAGYILKNPASKIKTYHYHPSDLHTYHDEKGENIKYLYVPKPYLFVELT
jgi:hypothetical protein